MENGHLSCKLLILKETKAEGSHIYIQDVKKTDYNREIIIFYYGEGNVKIEVKMAEKSYNLSY